MPPTKQSTFEVHVSDEIAIAISSLALSLMNAKVYHQNANTILAKKSFSFFSNGGFFEVNTIPIQADKSKISIISKSAWPTLFDWGINAENIRRFEQLVKQLINLAQLFQKQKV